MRSNHVLIVGGLIVVMGLNCGMGRHSSQYDVEAREAEKLEKKQGKLGNSSTELPEEMEAASQDAGLTSGGQEGAAQKADNVLDRTVKGAVKVATLGQGDLDNYEVEEPEAHSGEPTKFTIKIPGT